MASIRGKAPAGAILRLLRPDGTEPMTASADSRGEFAFANLTNGWYILSFSIPGDREMVRAVKLVETTETDFSRGLMILQGRRAPPVLSVCDALDQRETLNGQRVVIVGIFKSGMDETLRLDCPTELVTGDIGWPSSIGLTKVDNVPDALRGEVEKTRQEILKSAPPEAPLRPERVVGLYGVFVSLAGLSSAKCCSATVETSIPPARLLGISETDLRVIR